MKPIIIRSVTGRRIDLSRFSVDDVEVEAVECGLAKECRFANQIRDFYSVAQHSVHVAELLRAESLHVQKFGLIHDASEAYIGDVSRQLKHSPYMAGYRILEEEVQEVIENALMSPDEIAIMDEVEAYRLKAADDLMAIFERVTVRDRGTWRDPRGEVERAFADGYVAYTRKDAIFALLDMLPLISTEFTCWSPNKSRQFFAAKYSELFGA